MCLTIMNSSSLLNLSMSTHISQLWQHALKNGCQFTFFLFWSNFVSFSSIRSNFLLANHWRTQSVWFCPKSSQSVGFYEYLGVLYFSENAIFDDFRLHHEVANRLSIIYRRQIRPENRVAIRMILIDEWNQPAL